MFCTYPSLFLFFAKNAVVAVRTNDFQANLTTRADQVRVGVWNVLFKSLDNPSGQKAIADAVGSAADAEPFDFFGLVEAGGSQPHSQFPEWMQSHEPGPLKNFLHDMAYVSGKSGFETMALFYKKSTWDLVDSDFGAIVEAGRPYLVGLFTERKATGPRKLVVMSVHMPHCKLVGGRCTKWPADKPTVGSFLADMLAKFYARNGIDHDFPVLMMGDFNEYGECSVDGSGCKANFELLEAEIEPLWKQFSEESMADPTRQVVTCCTLWHERWRWDDWVHSFDKVLYSTSSLSVSSGPAYIPYLYPELPEGSEVMDEWCTGNRPPQPPGEGEQPLVLATAQGSWHRGWQASFEFVGDAPSKPAALPAVASQGLPKTPVSQAAATVHGEAASKSSVAASPRLPEKPAVHATATAHGAEPRSPRKASA